MVPARASEEDSFGLNDHLRKAATASSDERAAQGAREDLAEPQLDRSYDPAPLAVPETTGQAGRPPRHPKVLCDFGPSAKTGRQSAAPTATLLEQNLQLRTAAPPARRSLRLESLPPHNFKEPDGRRANPGVGGADDPAARPPAPGGLQTNSDRLFQSLERLVQYVSGNELVS